MVVTIVIVLLVAYISYRLYQYVYPVPDVQPKGKYVLITGCDTGFGHDLALELDQQGFHVLAAIYNQANQASLEQQLSPRATVLCLDITQPAQIEAAYQLVQSKTKSLHALVNNAGVDQDGLIDWITVDFMRKMMEVNFYGHVTMTKTFLPLLLARRHSRVVNICSVAGFFVAPSMSSYCASKFALEAFSDCLRREMHPWGLHVSVIEPGYMRTPIIHGHVEAMRQMWNGLSENVKDRWGETYMNALAAKRTNNVFIRLAEDPQKVVRALRHAVSSTQPCIRYRPGWQASLLFFPLSVIPAWLTDGIFRVVHDIHVTPASVRQQLQT